MPDGENLSREDAVTLVARIVRAVDAPVSVDIESGYGDVRATVEAIVEAGAVGASLAAAGVRRVSVGHLLAAAAYETVSRATRELLREEHTALTAVYPRAELQELLAV